MAVKVQLAKRPNDRIDRESNQNHPKTSQKAHEFAVPLATRACSTSWESSISNANILDSQEYGSTY